MTDYWLAQWLQISHTSWILLPSLLGYLVGLWVYRRFNQRLFLHPLIITAPLIFSVLYSLDIDFNRYYEGNGLLNWLLGPATVALAFPLSRQLNQLSSLLTPLCISLVCGGLFAALSAMSFAWLFDTGDSVLLSIAAKSVTTPIAIVLTEQLGGLVALVTVVVLLTGVAGAAFAQSIFKLASLKDERLQGLILGVSAHAIGTARAFEISQKCGAFSTLGMGLTGIWTSIFLPWAVKFFIHY